MKTEFEYFSMEELHDCKGSTKQWFCAVWIYIQQIARSHAEVSHRPPETILKELGYT